ncbi:MAG: flagellar protein FlgN [Candidatus Marinimicrobia bacterium]|nr:flagellar protein FlgN [Candidatus Neomarinimicrobiota bacterium]
MSQHDQYIELITILESEKTVYENLLETLKKKQKAVVRGDVENLRNLIMQEKEIIKKSEKAAQNRVDFINHFCKEKNIKGTDIPLKDFIGFSPKPEKQKMENIRYDLKNILNEITKVNRENETLLHFSINHVQKMTNIFLHAGREEMNMYSMNGKKYIKEINQKFVNQQI